MLIQAYKDDKLLPEQNTIDIERVLSILRALEKAKYSPAEYSSVAKAALKWLNSSSSQPASEAAVQIHASLGKYLFRNKELGKVHVASAHLARGEDMDSLAQVLAEASEVASLFIADCRRGEAKCNASACLVQSSPHGSCMRISHISHQPSSGLPIYCETFEVSR